MSTFKELVKDGLVPETTECHIYRGTKPDGCWALDGSNFPQGHILCVSYKNAMHALPKLLIDAYINKNNKIPTSDDLQEILKEVEASMVVAISQGRLPKD